MVLWARTVPIMKNVLGMHVHVILHILWSRLLGNSWKKISSIYVSNSKSHFWLVSVFPCPIYAKLSSNKY